MIKIITKLSKNIRTPKFLAILIALFALIIIPIVWESETFMLYLLCLIFVFAILAMAWNLHAGYAGIFSMGNITMFGIGAYAFAIMTSSLKVYPFLLIIASGAVTAVIASIIFFPCLKLSGAYFLLVSFSVMEAVNQIALIWTPVTGGAVGMVLPLRSTSIVPDYYMRLAVLLIELFVVYAILHSKVGYALRAIRGDADAAQTLGVNPRFYRLLVWAIASFFTGMAGALVAYYLPYIDPTITFNLSTNFAIIYMPVIGGSGTLLGPIIGAFLLTVIEQYTLASFPFIHLAILGIILILVTMFMPGGLIGMFRKYVMRDRPAARM